MSMISKVGKWRPGELKFYASLGYKVNTEI